MEYDSIVSGISQLGFPMFVAVWYMLKQSKDTQEMTKAFTALTEAIKMLGNCKSE